MMAEEKQAEKTWQLKDKENQIFNRMTATFFCGLYYFSEFKKLLIDYFSQYFGVLEMLLNGVRNWKKCRAVTQ